jgi:hypothetical protein
VLRVAAEAAGGARIDHRREENVKDKTMGGGGRSSAESRARAPTAAWRSSACTRGPALWHATLDAGSGQVWASLRALPATAAPTVWRSMAQLG